MDSNPPMYTFLQLCKYHQDSQDRAVLVERRNCAEIAVRVSNYYSANNGDNKEVALLVAQEIRDQH